MANKIHLHSLICPHKILYSFLNKVRNLWSIYGQTRQVSLALTIQLDLQVHVINFLLSCTTHAKLYTHVYTQLATKWSSRRHTVNGSDGCWSGIVNKGHHSINNLYNPGRQVQAIHTYIIRPKLELTPPYIVCKKRLTMEYNFAKFNFAWSKFCTMQMTNQILIGEL